MNIKNSKPSYIIQGKYLDYDGNQNKPKIMEVDKTSFSDHY